MFRDLWSEFHVLVLRHVVVADTIAANMRAGLAADGNNDFQMILSFVSSLPTGERISGAESAIMFGTSEIFFQRLPPFLIIRGEGMGDYTL
ncbi:hypothetical protein Vadar_028066 [Vaccinium darrowii]|uniref:Uncharacterized protein n=1 Tax=Vaccinium darrowii TaxID=229202 RepID=A0ACB7YGJ9_9ERIC|nr:hypothetical protein Vadar_028066 [Vaccinium darrowii]